MDYSARLLRDLKHLDSLLHGAFSFLLVQVFEQGVTAIPLSIDLWIHYVDYAIQSSKEDNSEHMVRL